MSWRKPVIQLLLRAGGSRIPERVGLMRQWEHASPNTLRRMQEHYLGALLLHAATWVPYYTRVLSESGVVRDGRVDLSRWSSIPVLTKEIIRAQGSTLHSTDPDVRSRKPFTNTSGGSTGEPVVLLQDRVYADWNIANKLYYKTEVGQEMGDPELRIWGSERDLFVGRETMTKRLQNWIYNRTDCNAFVLNEERMRMAVQQMREQEPTWVEGYVQSMYTIAQFIEERGLSIPSPRGVLVTAGTLTEGVRETIARVFGCPVLNRYGSREVGDMACSCEYNEGLHISVWNHAVEVLNADGTHTSSGERGRVIVTPLHAATMPLIRYEIGDIAVPADPTRVCSCGRTTPLLQNVTGRVVNQFKTRNGDVVDGEFFTHLFYGKAWCKQFQVIQTACDRVEMHVVLHQDNSQTHADVALEPDKATMEQAVRSVLGDACQIKWITHDSINPTPSGKHLYTISRV